MADEPTPQSIDNTENIERTDEQAQVEDVLVEEVSIDGMCGVY